MHIAICASFYPPYRGGYAESVRALAHGLASRGHRITVIACGVDSYEDGSVRVIGIPAWNPPFLHGSFPLPHPFATWRALRAASRRGVDIISTQTRFFPLSFIGFLFAKACGISIIHTERGSAHPVSHNRFIRSFGWIADQAMGRLIMSRSDRVIGVSEAACVFARKLGAKNPIRIRNGIDAGFWARPKDALDARRSGRIVFVGRLVHAKGVQDLIGAFARVMPDFPDASLAIVGDGPYLHVLVAQAASLGIANETEFIGALDQDGIRSVLHQAALFVNPSYSEGLPRAVLEAAAAGTPVIATDVGGTREIIMGQEFGTLVPPHDVFVLAVAMRQALSDHASGRRKAGALSARIASDFSVEKSAEEYESVMKRYVRDSR